jgi:hypothetical protein
MTIQYQGIRRKTTDVLDDYGQAHYLQNVRLKRVGELGRRAGLGKSTMAPLAGPVQFMIGAWSNVPYIVSGTGGDVTGQEDPLSYWTAATMRIPDGQVGQPVAPVINSITANPTSPPASYIIGLVTFTANVTYDGLSGALSYSWSTPMTDGGAGTANATVANANPGIFNFNAAATPGNYADGNLQVSTALNGFVVNLPFAYTVL